MHQFVRMDNQYNYRCSKRGPVYVYEPAVERMATNYYDYFATKSQKVQNFTMPNNAAVSRDGCSYINVLGAVPPNLGAPIAFASYGSYVGALDRDRRTPNYVDKTPGGACNGPQSCVREFSFV